MMQCPTPYSRYRVTRDGEVWSGETRVYGHLQKLGYVRYCLRDDHGERHVFQGHRFIYGCFNPLFDDSMEIDHIDTNRANNSIANLAALAKEEHAVKTRNQVKVPYDKIKRVTGDKIDGEMWYRPTEVVAAFLGVIVGLVSNMGRITLNGKPGSESRGLLWENGTYMFKNVSIARIVCATFHGPPPNADCSARHINGDRKDNRAMNLMWSDFKAGTVKPPACWAEPMDSIVSCSDLALSFCAIAFSDQEMQDVDAGLTVTIHEDVLEAAWVEHAQMNPSVYKAFQLREEQSMYIKFKKLLVLLNFSVKRRDNNSTRPLHRHIKLNKKLAA